MKEMMSINDHIAELKRKLKFSLMLLLLSTFVGYIFSGSILDVLLDPLISVFKARDIQRNLIYTDLAEAFLTKMRVSFFVGLVISTPLILWQLYAFIAPGLFRREKVVFICHLIASTTMFYLGILLVYSYVMPLAWDFFLSFEDDMGGGIKLIFEAKISEYLSLVINMMLAFGITFQLPIILVILCQVGLVKAQDLSKRRRHAVVVIFAFAAVVTPPDVMSQIILAIPLWLLYEISILVCSRIQSKEEVENA
jgi:sec-independent protein translocase protein TatC